MNKNKATNDFSVYAKDNRNEMISFIPETSENILDVGCSVGNFGELLKSIREIEVWGVEIDSEAATLASEKIDNVICGSFNEELDLPKNKFDCIVFNDVLEHLVDPYSALRYAKTLLKEDGKVVASIPNVRYFGNIWLLMVHKNWEYTDTGILDRTHLRFFTKKSIVSMFESLGYHVDGIDGINSLASQDPYFTTKFKLLNLVTFNHIDDMRWLQFAITASPLKEI